MQIGPYDVVRQFARTLRNLDAILGKAEAHAEARKFNPDNYLGLRLFPDMLPFTAQIRIACDVAKFVAARASGQAPPQHADDEKTWAEVRGRIAKVLAYLDAFGEADFAGAQADTLVPVPNPPGKVMRLTDYILTRQIPNFYFHVSTAYGLLRAGGVEIGKVDYLGALDLLDA